MFLQDHLESFFNGIRSSLGCNNNPTTTQFLSSYKKLLYGAKNKSLYGNSFDDNTALLEIPAISESAIDFLGQESSLDTYTDKMCQLISTLSPYKENIIIYMRIV